MNINKQHVTNIILGIVLLGLIMVLMSRREGMRGEEMRKPQREQPTKQEVANILQENANEATVAAENAPNVIEAQEVANVLQENANAAQEEADIAIEAEHTWLSEDDDLLGLGSSAPPLVSGLMGLALLLMA